MHRNDWLPVAQVVTYGDWTRTPQAMCSGKVLNRATVHEVHAGSAVVPAKAAWDGHAYTWFTPCMFVEGHPGECGRELPDIFLPDGRVKPQIERLLKNRRKTHGTLDTTPDNRPDHTGPP